jgi:hypothetical protein
VVVDDDANDNILMAAERTSDAQTVAFADDPVWLCLLAVHVDLATLTRALGF